MVKHLYHRSNKEIGQLLFSIALILILSNLTLKTLVPNIVVNSFTILLIAFIQYYYGLKYGLVFFITQLLMLSNFTYGNNQCGLYNVTTAIALAMILARSGNWKLALNIRNGRLLILLFFTNILGYILHPIEIVGIVQGIVTLSCFLVLYLLISGAEFDLGDIAFMFKGLMIVQTYSLAISLLKLLNIYDASLPMFGGVVRIGSMTQAGVMGNSELFAQLNLIILIFVTVALISDELRKELSFTNYGLFFYFYVSLANIVLARSRSVIVLYVVALVLMILIFKGHLLNQRILRNFAILIISTILFFVFLGSIIRSDYSFNEFSEIEGFRINNEQIISGYGINRSTVFEIALDRLKQRSWIVGYGWGNEERNRVAWGISSMPRVADYHNFYYSLPMIFGWIGFLIIVMIMLNTAFKLFSIRDSSISLEGLILRRVVFFLVLFVLIVAQFLTSPMRDPNYFMIFWIFLGISNSILDINKE